MLAARPINRGDASPPGSFPFLRAEVLHFHTSPDEKIKRKLGEKCHYMQIEEYTQLSGNQITGLASVSALKEAIFEAHKSKSAHRPCGRGRGR
jgi:hypothetical protein